MDDLNLCIGRNKYLVGFCCLHTQQLKLSNALTQIIGKCGLENRNALQVIHTCYDLQESMEFGLWTREWGRAAAETVRSVTPKFLLGAYLLSKQRRKSPFQLYFVAVFCCCFRFGSFLCEFDVATTMSILFHIEINRNIIHYYDNTFDRHSSHDYI